MKRWAHPDPGLVEALFASLLKPSPWVDFLDAMRERFAASFVTLILTPHDASRPSLMLTPGADLAASTEYREHLFANDPFTGLPDGEVRHFRRFLDETGRGGDSAFRDFIARTGDEILGVDLHEAGDAEVRLRLSRTPGVSRFRASDEQRLQALVPLLRIACRLFSRLAEGQSEQRIYSSVVEQMALGIVVLDRAGTILNVNAAAERILAQGDGIARRGNRIDISDRVQARRFGALLADGAVMAGPQMIRIPRPNDGADLCLWATSARAPRHVSERGGPAMVLYLSDPGHAPQVASHRLREMLGVTHSEALTAAAIADGSSLSDVAERLGVSRNTVRAHLRAIYSKTGVNRQSLLVRLIHQSLAGLNRPE